MLWIATVGVVTGSGSAGWVSHTTSTRFPGLLRSVEDGTGLEEASLEDSSISVNESSGTGASSTSFCWMKGVAKKLLGVAKSGVLSASLRRLARVESIINRI